VRNSASNYLAVRARRFVADLANFYTDPEFFVRKNDVRPDSDLEKTYAMIRLVGQALRKAFETSDAYERDWFLLWARVENAAAQAPLGLGRVPGVIPIAAGTVIDRNVSFVQRKLASTMAVCAHPGCTDPCFFKTRNRNRQKYCSPTCFQACTRASHLRWWNRVGRVNRANQTHRPR